MPTLTLLIDGQEAAYYQTLDRIFNEGSAASLQEWMLRNGWKRIDSSILRNEFPCFTPTEHDDYSDVPPELAGSILGYPFVKRAPIDPRYGEYSVFFCTSPTGFIRDCTTKISRVFAACTFRRIICTTIVGNGGRLDLDTFTHAVEQILQPQCQLSLF